MEHPDRDEDGSAAMVLSFMRGWLADAEGDTAWAAAAIRQVVRPEHIVRHRWRWQPVWHVTATRVGMRSGDLDLAHEAASLATAAAERNPSIATFVGLALQAQGLLRGDTATLDRAVEVLGASPRPLIRADARVDYGRVLLSGGHRDAGVTALDGAWDIYNGLGAAGRARQVQRLLQSAGIRRRWSNAPARPVDGWAALTPTQQRVARLIAEGHTNRSAAAELVLSPNTIATHLRSIFCKLGVSSRVQLTRSVLAKAGHGTPPHQKA